jgi:hypothetical protein
MNFALFVLDSLTGEEKIVNRFFTSEQEAQQYCVLNDLIFSRILSEQEYQNLILQKQHERLLKQQYRGYQQPQQPRTMITVNEEEPEEQPRIPSSPKPVMIFAPNVRAPNFRFSPVFIKSKVKK